MIHIAHLFPYELNLYGENGNIKALVNSLTKKKMKVKVDNIKLKTKINWRDYDLIYIGSGKEDNINIVKELLKNELDNILEYIDAGKILLATGNAVEALSILNLYTVSKYDKVLVDDVTATTSLCKGKITGFQNTHHLISSTDSVLFNIEHGYSNNDSGLEGYVKNNFYATTLIGPILAINDNLNNYFVDLLLENSNNK